MSILKYSVVLTSLLLICSCDGGSDASGNNLSPDAFMSKISGTWEVSCRPISAVVENFTESWTITPDQITRSGYTGLAICPTEIENDGEFNWVRDIISVTADVSNGVNVFRIRFTQTGTNSNGEVYEDLLYEESGFLYVGDMFEPDGPVQIDLNSPYTRVN